MKFMLYSQLTSDHDPTDAARSQLSPHSVPSLESLPPARSLSRSRNQLTFRDLAFHSNVNTCSLSRERSGANTLQHRSVPTFTSISPFLELSRPLLTTHYSFEEHESPHSILKALTLKYKLKSSTEA